MFAGEIRNSNIKILNKFKKNKGECFTITQINTWKESGGVTPQQTYQDMKEICRIDKNVQLYDEKQPMKYCYESKSEEFNDIFKVFKK